MYQTIKLINRKAFLIKRQLSSLYENDDCLVIKILISGICRSDLKEIEKIRTIRSDFGHELIGEVIHNSTNANLKIGNRVVYDPHIKLDYRSTGFAEYLTSSGPKLKLEKAFIKVGSEIPLKRAVFIEPFACAIHAIDNLRNFLNRKRFNDLNIGIVGSGNAGILMGMLAKYYGANITLFNRGIERIKFLKNKLAIKDFEYKILSTISENKFDIVIPATSFIFPEVLRKCFILSKNDGFILLFGGTKKEINYKMRNYDFDNIRRNEKIINIELNNKNISVGGTHGATTNDFMKSIKLLTMRPRDFPVENMISKEISLEKLPQELDNLLKTNYIGKTIVNY